MLLVGFAWWAKQLHFKGWEKLCLGPFRGERYHGQLTGEPASRLSLSSGYRIEAYATNAIHQTNQWAVVRLTDRVGMPVWTRVLKPKMTNNSGMVNYPFLEKVELQKYLRLDGNHKVVFSCNWGRGGVEQGVITLRKDFQFERFKVSW